MMVASKALVISSQSKRLNHISQALESAKWEIEAFIEPTKALKSMQKQSYTAIFCDEKLKGASVRGFLNWHSRLSPDIPFYIIGEPSSTLPKVTGVIPFPMEIDKIPYPTGIALEPSNAFQTTVDELKLPFSYKVNTISLSGDTSILQIDNLLEMMGMGKQSSLISLGENDDRGRIYVEKGLLLHASFKNEDGTLKIGLSALVDVLASEDLFFKVIDFEKPEKNSINLPVAYALTEAARLVDEHQRYGKVIESIIKICPSVVAVAIGDIVSLEPLESYGKGNALLKEAQNLLRSQRAELGQNLSAFLIVLGERVLMLENFGEGNLLVTSAFSKDRDTLYNAVRQALKQISA